ncbi:hypothetical protein [Blastopirellula marina]|uniref:Uncharacterized protein n=1 Tax=Blastopirellula marina TaxID=124 RepID=A0A2S8GQ79_9BACT|nr:hypothetical protein [Blastopirellula marina]PQO46583.1 hypothetical protein C5Y93_08920 [Blastopirellula marina]
MYQSEPQMAVGPLFVILAGLLLFGALMATIIGLVLASSKGGRILLGLGLAALMGMILIAAGFWMVASTGDVVVSRSTELRVDSSSRTGELRNRESTETEQPAIQLNETPQISEPETISPEVSESDESEAVFEPELPDDLVTDQAATNAPPLPVRTMTTNPYSPFPEIPRPMFPPELYRGPSSSQRFASSASSDMHLEMERMREEARHRMNDHFETGIPSGPYESPRDDQPDRKNDPDSLDAPGSTGTPKAEPAPSSIIPPGRPKWVEQDPDWEEETYAMAVSSGPYSRGTDCRRELDQEIDRAIDEYVNELLGNSQAAAMLGSDLDTLKDRVVVDTYREKLSPSVGPMQQWHALLKFGGDVHQKVREFWKAQQQVSRIVYTGAGFLGLLGLLSVGYLGMTLTGEGSQVSPWLVSAVTVIALGALLVVGVIFVRTFPML